MYEPTRDDLPPGRGTLFDRARQVAEKLTWLSPLKNLASAPSSKFGRQIESALARIAQGDVIRLQLRKRDAAVVLSTQHYEELLQLKALHEELISQLKVSEVAEAAESYDVLYQRLTDASSREAADALFDADDGELGRAWRTGHTERP